MITEFRYEFVWETQNLFLKIFLVLIFLYYALNFLIPNDLYQENMAL